MPRPRPLSADTRSRLTQLFRPEDQAEAEGLLVEKCGTNLPGLERAHEPELEAIRLKVLDLSRGDLRALGEAVDLARWDWRDLFLQPDPPQG